MNTLPAPFEPATPAMIVGHSTAASTPPLGLGEPFALMGGDRLGPGGIAFDLGHDWQRDFIDAVADACDDHLAAERPWFKMPATALVGHAGSGRTHAARMLASAAGVPHVILNLSDPVIAMNVSASGEINEALWVSPVVTAMAATRCANPVVTVVGAEHNADAAMALVAMVDPMLGRAWREDRIATSADLGEVSWFIQCSDPSNLPSPLVDRLQIVPMRQKNVVPNSTIALSLLTEVLADLGIARNDPAVVWHDIVDRIDWCGFTTAAKAYADLRSAVIQAQYDFATQRHTNADLDPY
ncbi:hypothetical protein ACM61V_02180 [Sphingomonas sp. TX0543]|uniref:hypothetical protein n=1 Tax=unclassified Sphingomonas TaxID=196159 RepID=UPI0010F64438|nr:hypothetical protein [Sphingomonas sp. 3P27F8]